MLAAPGAPAAELLVIRDGDMPMPPGIAEVAARAGVTVREVDAAAGVPEEVGYLPAVAYLGDHGAQLFAGDPYDAPAVGRFVDTASRVSITYAPVSYVSKWSPGSIGAGEEIALSAGGIGFPVWVQVEDLRGDVLEHDDQHFAAEVRQPYLFGRMRLFSPYTTAQLGRASWRWRIIPRRSESGAYTLQLAIFSPFDRYNPAWQNDESQITGKWEERAPLHLEAAVTLDREMQRLVSDPSKGRGYREMASRTRIRWEDLGANQRKEVRVERPRHWRVIPDPAIATPVEFRYPYPLSEIFGGATATSGTLTLGAEGALAPAEAHVTVSLAAVRMYQPELDATVQSIAKAVSFPVASFALDSVESPDPNLLWGVPTEFAATGAMTLAGRTATVPVNVRAEPYLTAEGAPRILADATFDVNIKEAFGLEGPDGPEPEKDTLGFRVRLLFAPE